MTKLIKSGAYAQDVFAPVVGDAPLPEGAVLVSLVRFQKDREALLARNSPIGIRLQSSENPEVLGADDIRASPLGYAAHQLGTHRMGGDPASSVVNANLRAHDVPNLYLVGGGAFVTVSSSPPTLTIAALAIRAADHIAAVYRGPQTARAAHRPGAPARLAT